jgi:Glycosyl transferases group 1
LKIVWVHNSPDRRSGTFMWDVHDCLAQTFDIHVDAQLIPVIRSFGDFRRLRRERANSSGRTSIVHGQYGSLVGLLSTLQGGYQIVSLRGSDMYPPQGTWRQKLAGCARMAMTYAAALKADRLLVMSHAMQNYIARWPFIRRTKIHVLPDPAGEMFWPETAASLMPRVQATALRVVIASLKSNNPIKRLELVADAERLCQSAGLDVRLEQLSGVTREQVKTALGACDAVALASTHEGWPNILKEGLLLGKPFIATDVGDLKAFAGRDPQHSIVEPTAIDFAFAFVDALLAKALRIEGTDCSLVPFHPLSAALKHVILYQACKG